MWLILTRIWMTILELIWERLCNEYATWCSINLFRSIKSLLYYHWMNNDQLWSNLPPRVWPHNIKPLPRGTLLTTVEQPDLVPSWSRCWPQKAWSWSTDTIQTLVGLIHIHIMHNWGPRPKIILPEAGDTTKSMVMWLILTRLHNHSGDDVGEIMQWICRIMLYKHI